MGNTILLDKNGAQYPGWETYQTRHKQWGIIYDGELQMGTDMTRYERMEREHDARQPFIAEELIEALQSNVCRSYRNQKTIILCAPQKAHRKADGALYSSVLLRRSVVTLTLTLTLNLTLLRETSLDVRGVQG